MPAVKVLQPVLKMKVDELFLCWLSETATQVMLQDYLRSITSEEKIEIGSGDALSNEHIFTEINCVSKQSMLSNLLSPTSPPHVSATLPLGTPTSPRSFSNIRGMRRSSSTRRVSAFTIWPTTLNKSIQETAQYLCILLRSKSHYVHSHLLPSKCVQDSSLWKMFALLELVWSLVPYKDCKFYLIWTKHGPSNPYCYILPCLMGYLGGMLEDQAAGIGLLIIDLCSQRIHTLRIMFGWKTRWIKWIWDIPLTDTFLLFVLPFSQIKLSQTLFISVHILLPVLWSKYTKVINTQNNDKQKKNPKHSPSTS